jgi:hypothetical protein
MALVEMVLQAQSYIPGPPAGPEACFDVATRNDKVTINTWHDQWLAQIKENSVHGFSEHSALQELGKCAYQPVVVAGSGPSLKKNWKDLTATDEHNRGRQGIRIVSCLHNFGFFEDRDVMGLDDYYMTLDAGQITLSEVTEGGTQHEPDWYWERTKDRTLLAYTGAYPELIRRWKGKILWFFTPPATDSYGQELRKLVDHDKVPCLSVGGCVLGGAWYYTMGVLGASIPIMIGADFAFGYDRKFHGWESQYDKKFAGVIPATDIYGNRVWTWPSYFGFAQWFTYMATGGSGGNAQLMINATEGGILGAYPEGNIQQIIQLDLKTALAMFTRWKMMPDMVKRSGSGPINILF